MGTRFHGKTKVKATLRLIIHIRWYSRGGNLCQVVSTRGSSIAINSNILT
jgi:hypothetical protein